MTLPHGYDSPYHFDMALQEPVHYMMHRGIKVDMSRQAELSQEFKEKWKSQQEDLNAVAGRELNVYSPKQIKQWLYEDLNLPPRKHNGKLTTREEKLRNLMSLCKEKVQTLKTPSGRERWMRGFISIKLILKIRGYRKKVSSYIDIEVDNDFRIRTTLSVGGTETARFSSSKTLWGTGLNLQTIPHSLRSMFIADPGYELCELDLNRGESWIYSHLSEDPEMMQIHRQGRDFHAATAAALSREFADEPWSEEKIKRLKNETEEAYRLRYLGKRCNHAFAYRMGPYRAMEVVNQEADDTGITVRVKDTKLMRKIWLGLYMRIPTWWNEIEQQLDEDRTIITPFGRERTFYGHWGDSMFKDATAHVPQSSSVDYLNWGMLGVYHNIVVPGKWGTELLHQNHDSILIQYKEGYRDQVIPAVISELTNTVPINGYDVTIPIEAEYGRNWGELTEWEEAA